MFAFFFINNSSALIFFIKDLISFIDKVFNCFFIISLSFQKIDGLYAEIMGLLEAPTGMKVRLRFPDGHRETIPVQRVRVIQDDSVPRSKDSWF